MTHSSATGSNSLLDGGADNDTIKNRGSSVTIDTGAGDDTLYGQNGDDVFIYKPNEGKDKIMDFAAGDMLKILNADGSAGSFTNSSFKSGNLTLAVSGGGK